eukprot:9399290-Pyramimonas_sp.AAC.1
MLVGGSIVACFSGWVVRLVAFMPSLHRFSYDARIGEDILKSGCPFCAAMRLFTLDCTCLTAAPSSPAFLGGWFVLLS